MKIMILIMFSVLIMVVFFIFSYAEINDYSIACEKLGYVNNSTWSSKGCYKFENNNRSTIELNKINGSWYEIKKGKNN